MKIRVQDAYDAVLILSAIIRERRPLPLKGAYRVARMHAKLLPEYTIANDQRDGLIKAYDYKEEGAALFSVPPDKMQEFTEAWNKIASIEIEITDLEPIPLAQLDLGNLTAASIHAGELLDLGPLVTD